MGIDPQKGIHWPTMISCTVGLIALNMYTQLIQPNFPFLIKVYFPDVWVPPSFLCISRAPMWDTMPDT